MPGSTTWVKLRTRDTASRIAIFYTKVCNRLLVPLTQHRVAVVVAPPVVGVLEVIDIADARAIDRPCRADSSRRPSKCPASAARFSSPVCGSLFASRF